MKKIKTAIFISGRGSNMMALVEAARAEDFPAEFVLVVANDPGAAGLTWAAQQGIKTFALDHKPFGKDREAHERALDAALREAGVEFICLAGYLRVLTPWLVQAW
ncbi:MAG: formyltransferase family protein, partial [Asticcacaulis sp.]